MKNLKIALGMVSVFAILIIISCGKNSGGPINPGPIEPPPTNNPVIKDFKPSSATVSVVLTGKPEDANVYFSWETANGTTSFDGTAVGAVGNSSPAVPFTGKTYILSVVGGAGHTDQQSRIVTVSIDPTFQKMCGTTEQGQRWKKTRSTAYFTTTGTLNELLQPYEVDDVYTFYPAARWKVEFGTLNSRTTVNEEFKFTSSTSEIATQPYTLQPIRAVKFTPAGMEWSYTKNNTLYTIYFEKL